MRRFPIALVSAALLLLPALPAMADEEWCADEPPVSVVYQGQTYTAEVTVYAHQTADFQDMTLAGTVRDGTFVITVKGVTGEYKATAVLDGVTADDQKVHHGVDHLTFDLG